MTVDELQVIVDRIALEEHFPFAARDGDCIAVSDRLATRLNLEGVEAEVVNVWATAALSPHVILRVHRAVRVGDLIADCTFTQFDPLTAARWVCPGQAYADILAAAWECNIAVTPIASLLVADPTREFWTAD